MALSGPCRAKTIKVGQNHPIKKIKEALTLANDGDSILVYKGTYHEGNITINKKICLLGYGYPILDGENKFEVISVKANSVTISGFNIINSGVASLDDPCGIKVYGNINVTIENNILENNFFGIYLQNSQKCTVKNNSIKASSKNEQSIGNGIHCWKSDRISIESNQISGHRDGIYFEFVTNSKVTKNLSEANIRYGLHFMFSNDDRYVENTFKNNGAGVAVMFTQRVQMLKNIFEENWGDSAYGLLLKEISDGRLIGNTFIKNTVAVFMEGTSRMHIEKNAFVNNGWAMKIQASCADNTITDNNFLGNTFDMGTNGSLVLNTFTGNFWDKFEGYDLDKDGFGDIPYHPLSLFAVLTENNPSAMLLFRSFMITLLDKSEKILPSITPDNFVDSRPRMKSLSL